MSSACKGQQALGERLAPGANPWPSLCLLVLRLGLPVCHFLWTAKKYFVALGQKVPTKNGLAVLAADTSTQICPNNPSLPKAFLKKQGCTYQRSSHSPCTFAVRILGGSKMETRISLFGGGTGWAASLSFPCPDSGFSGAQVLFGNFLFIHFWSYHLFQPDAPFSCARPKPTDRQ